MLAQLTDPRKTTEEQAQQLVRTAKPVYYFTSGMHSPETGGPEMLMEMAYRLAVEETPFIQNIRNNVITLITPVVEVDGREKMVDTYYFNKKLPEGAARLPLMYWGKYVQHDNNRDGMGQFLALTRNVEQVNLDWKPPSPSEVAVAWMPVSISRSVTLAPGTAACDASRTVPRTTAVSNCARAQEQSKTRKARGQISGFIGFSLILSHFRYSRIKVR